MRLTGGVTLLLALIVVSRASNLDYGSFFGGNVTTITAMTTYNSNAYVVGYTSAGQTWLGSTSAGAFLAVLQQSGGQWSLSSNVSFSGSAYSVAVDASGNAYVGGYQLLGSYSLAVYAANGTHLSSVSSSITNTTALYISGNSLYAAGSSSSSRAYLELINVTNPKSPVVSGTSLTVTITGTLSVTGLVFAQGTAYVVGSYSGTGFTPAGLNGLESDTNSHGYILAANASLTGWDLPLSTSIAGNANDHVNGVATDGNNVYVVGDTTSDGLKTTSNAQQVHISGVSNQDTIFYVFPASGGAQNPSYFSYFGFNGASTFHTVVPCASPLICTAGSTTPFTASGIPNNVVSQAIDVTAHSLDGFLVAWDLSASPPLEYLSFYGGLGADSVVASGFLGSDWIFAGFTTSTALPVTGTPLVSSTSSAFFAAANMGTVASGIGGGGSSGLLSYLNELYIIIAVCVVVGICLLIIVICIIRRKCCKKDDGDSRKRGRTLLSLMRGIRTDVADVKVKTNEMHSAYQTYPRSPSAAEILRSTPTPLEQVAATPSVAQIEMQAVTGTMSAAALTAGAAAFGGSNTGSMRGSMGSGSSVMSDRSWDIPYNDLEIVKELGEGGFGVVYLATWRQTKVAVKQLKNMGQKQLEEFFAETALMSKLRPHTNVVMLFGVCKNPPTIVVEFLGGGCLLNLLRAPEVPDASMMFRVLRGTVAGMHHLHLEGIIHRDLAARNILMTEGGEPKVSDFGMSRATGADSGFTKSEVGPLKWMSPEALMDKSYSKKSDVWAFGVLIWEVMTRGQEPYPEYDGFQAAHKVAQGEEILQPPNNANPEINEIMRDCFAYGTDNRPSFEEIGRRLDKIKVFYWE